MALFRFGSNPKPQASNPKPAPTLATRGMVTPGESTVDALCAARAAVGAALPEPGGTPAATAPEDDGSDVAVSELNLGDDDFSSIFGSQPSQFSDTSFEAGSLHNDPWSTRLRLD
ncbi:MAG TPA: hypothetical protein VGE16_18765 [Albitalea sp.]